jgi:hypothetical protein
VGREGALPSPETFLKTKCENCGKTATGQPFSRIIDYLVFYNSSNHVQNNLYESNASVIGN